MRKILVPILTLCILAATALGPDTAEAGANTFCHKTSRTPYPLQGPRPTIGCQVDWIATPANPINVIWHVEYYCVIALPVGCQNVSVPQSYTWTVAALTSSGNKKDYPSGNCVEGLTAGVLAALTWEPSSGASSPQVSGDTAVGKVGLSHYCNQPP